MSDELDGLFNQPIDDLSIVRRDTRDDIPAGDFELAPSEPAADQEPAQEPVQQLEPAAEPQAQAPVQEPVSQVVEPAAPTPEPEVLDWKQVLKNEGYDDFALGLLEYYKSTGDFTPYLEAKTVDYSALPDEEILRRDLRSKYSELSDDEFAILYRKRVEDQYSLGEMFTEDEQKLGRIELKYAAKEVRERLIDQQKNFKAPERVQAEQPDVQQQYEQWKQFVDSDPMTQQVLTGKRITIGDGEQVVNYELQDVNTVMQQTYNPQQFFSTFTRQDGTVDMAKWYKVVAFASNPSAYEKTLINHGKTNGRQEIYNDIKNPPKPDVGQTPGGGTGNPKEDLLNEFLKSGVHRGR